MLNVVSMRRLGAMLDRGLSSHGSRAQRCFAHTPPWLFLPVPLCCAGAYDMGLCLFRDWELIHRCLVFGEITPVRSAKEALAQHYSRKEFFSQEVGYPACFACVCLCACSALLALLALPWRTSHTLATAPSK